MVVQSRSFSCTSYDVIGFLRNFSRVISASRFFFSFFGFKVVTLENLLPIFFYLINIYTVFIVCHVFQSLYKCYMSYS